MLSKTMLATNPRHRPAKAAVAAGWREGRVGQWLRDAARVCLEIDGLWHSYASPSDTLANSPGFPSVSAAMRDAEQRRQQLVSVH